jgi:hypothetical protein
MLSPASQMPRTIIFILSSYVTVLRAVTTWHEYIWYSYLFCHFTILCLAYVHLQNDSGLFLSMINYGSDKFDMHLNSPPMLNTECWLYINTRLVNWLPPMHSSPPLSLVNPSPTCASPSLCLTAMVTVYLLQIMLPPGSDEVAVRGNCSGSDTNQLIPSIPQWRLHNFCQLMNST